MRNFHAPLWGLVLLVAALASAKIAHSRGAKPAHAPVGSASAPVSPSKPAIAEPTEFSRAMPMGGHMVMAETRPVQPGDWDRADAMAEAARRFILRYTDYRAAERDGYVPFMPEQKQPMYHFSRQGGPLPGAPDRLNSIIYEKPGPRGEKDGYHLVGVMFTAPANATPAELDRIAPMSIAQWHMHTNACWAPAGYPGNWLAEGKVYGYRGTIVTEAECKAKGGTFHAQSEWAVHVFPLHKSPVQRWHHGMTDEGSGMNMDGTKSVGMKMDGMTM